MKDKIVAIIEEEREKFKFSKRTKQDLRAYNEAVAERTIELFKIKKKGKKDE